MQLGFLVPIDMRALSLGEVVKWASENGFDAVDARNIEDVDPDLCKRYGVEIAVTRVNANVLTPDDDVRDKAQEEALRTIDKAVSKGIDRAMIPHWRQPGMSIEESIEIFKKGYMPVVEHAERHDFKLVMEVCPHGGRSLAASPELWRALFDAVPSPNLGICLDPSHLVWQGIDYIRATKEFSDRIFLSHAKDTEILPDKLYEYGVMGKSLNTSAYCTGWWRYRLPGYGEIDWARFISALIEVGYDDVLAIEHEDRIWYGSPEENKKGLLLAKNVLAPYVI